MPKNLIIYKLKACNFAIPTQSFSELLLFTFFFSSLHTVKYANKIRAKKKNLNENSKKERNTAKRNIDDYIQKVCRKKEAWWKKRNIIYSLISLMIPRFVPIMLKLWII